MNALAQPSVIVFATLALTSLTPAQRDEGPMLAMPVAFSVEAGGPSPGPGSAQANTLYSKKGGFGEVPAGQFSPMAGRPDFRYSEILRDITRLDMMGNPLPVEIDAFSIGLDVIPTSMVDGSNAIDFGDMAWGSLSLTVRQDMQAEDVDPTILHEKMIAVDGAGADVFNYVFLSSGLIEEEFRGTVWRALDGAETGYSIAPGLLGQIVSLDVHVPLFELDDDLVIGLERRPIAYFSVTNATRNNLIPGISGGLPRSGATVYRMEWDEVLGRWTSMPPLLTYQDLGFSLPDDAEMDALAFDSMRERVIFSLSRETTPTGWSQLLTADTSTLGPGPTSPGPVGGSGTGATTLLIENLTEKDEDEAASVVGVKEDENGEPVSGKVRIGVEGDVTGICPNDPSLSIQDPMMPTAFSYVGTFAWGTPRAWSFPDLSVIGFTASQGVELSLFRNCVGSNASISMHATSEAPFGLVVVSAAPSAMNLGILVPIGPELSTTFSLQLPLPTSVLLDVPIDLAVFSLNGTSIQHSPIVQIRR